MKQKATVKPNAKRVAMTVYMSQQMSNRILKGYAAALLDGYTGTKQAYLTRLLESALANDEQTAASDGNL